MTSKLRMVDLFAGSGAFSYAFEQTGMVDVVYANDFVQESKDIYDLNFRHELTLGDINDIVISTIPSHDILTGGFPCQPFSIAGKREGFDDKRSNVFWKILEIIDFHSPSFIVLENVKNLNSHDNGNTLKIILENLTIRGYFVTSKILNTSVITGIPQNRERIYFVCSKIDHPEITLNFEIKEKQPISSFYETDINSKYYYSDRFKVWDLIRDNVIKQNTVYQYRRVYVRENMSGECPTLTANMGGGGHNVPLILDDNGIRKLTPRECFNLQGFPHSYILPNISDSKLYKIAGNAITVSVAQLIAKQIISCIREIEE